MMNSVVFIIQYMVMRIVLTVAINALSLWIVSYLLGESRFDITPFAGYLAAGLVMGVLNAIVKPILSLLSLPFMLMTFGAFLAVINIALLWLCVYLFNTVLTPLGVEFIITGGIVTYTLAALILSVFNTIFYFIMKMIV